MAIYFLVWGSSTTTETYAKCATALEFRQLYNVAPNYVRRHFLDYVSFIH